MDGASVEIRGLVKKYSDFSAVDDVSVKIKAGEFIALLGPSGSGKSTILQTIAGFDAPTNGDILINGHAVTHIPPHRRNIGMVFQKYALFPHMTVWENIAFPLKMRKIPREQIKEQVNSALHMVQLDEFGYRRPDQLSGGQQQRVALARAIVFRPTVLLMDEPLGALDKKLRENMQLEIKRLQRSLGATVIFVTHDQEEALTMADRIAVLNKGKLEQIGTPEELYERPVNSFVADFIGEMNFLEGVITTIDDKRCLTRIQGGALIPIDMSNEGKQSLRSGQFVRIAIRPERVTIRKEADDKTDHATVKGRVKELIYVGDSIGCIAEISPELTIKTVISSRDKHCFAIGDSIYVTWDISDALCYRGG